MNNLKKIRGSCKGKFTRLQTFIDAVNPDNTPTADDIKHRIEYLEGIWNDYGINHHLIINDTEEADLDPEEADYAEVEAKYFSLKSKLSNLANSNSHDSSDKSTTAIPTNRSDVKLPRLDLPKFSGNMLEWTSFHDLFKSMVHVQPISNAQKLHYLKTSLTGEAATLIHSIEVTDANYNQSWELLKLRYENKRQLIQCHLQSLFTQPALKEESSSALRKLLDQTNKCTRALNGLGHSTDDWDAILVYLVTDRMDSDTRRHWELQSTGTEYPLFDDVTKYVEQRCRALDASGGSKLKSKPQPSFKSTTATHHTSVNSCPVCQENHSLFQCSSFGSMDQKLRSETVRKATLCFNCLRGNHAASKCTSKSSCKKCGQRHHTLLHREPLPETSKSSNSLSASSEQSSVVPVLLSTAMANVMDSSGNYQTCRLLIDGGSEASFITEECCKRLGLKRSKASVAITGIGQTGSGKSKGKVKIIINSLYNDFSITHDALIMSRITGLIPSLFIHTSQWTHLDHIKLADPNFNQPRPIDILLGADICEDLIIHGKVTGDPYLPSARNSHLGWIVSGRVNSQQQYSIMSNISTLEVEEQLRKFWEIEEVSPTSIPSKEEDECQTHFALTHFRQPDGRYVTSLPMKSHNLGYSKSMALRRLHSVEKRLTRDPTHHQQYELFMDEYLRLGHMELIPINEREEILGNTNYLPHHYILKESTTTSLRVVFDGSAKSSNGYSLNNILMVGPTIQDDMYNILLRFRLYKYAFTADIGKMYRQVKVNSKDSNLLRILWRKDFSKPVEQYRLLTVTYGTSSAPYTATRVLQQLAFDEGEAYPLAKEIILRDFYVDDLMSGSDDLNTGLQIQSQLIQVLQKAGFQLRKWSSNNPDILEAVPEDYREIQLPISIDPIDAIKTLGLRWNTGDDSFFFKVNLDKCEKRVSKRIILSETARLYDPLGWLSPVLIRAKMLFQKLWLAGLGWDQDLPTDLFNAWVQFRQQLFELEFVKLPRCIGQVGATYQLHGFSDASELAYAAVIYLRSELPNNDIQVRLICSKTKVAPVKQLSIPRLELCGASLLSSLIRKVTQALSTVSFGEIYGWSDSTVTLGWIAGHPSRWKTFVANRVTNIQNHLPPSQWKHVPGTDNPADLASRGVTSSQLADSTIWWNGPSWLSKPPSSWPISPLKQYDVQDELRPVKSQVLLASTSSDILDRFSSLSKLIRVTSYITRFKQGCLKIPRSESTMLSTAELRDSLMTWIKVVQQSNFQDIIASIQSKSTSHPLSSLNPFIDQNGILRVGGRLSNADITVDAKYPTLLPKKSQLTKLIISNEHIKLLHAGAQMMMASLSQRYWIVGGRSLIRHYVHKCVRCIRFRAITLNQFMGDLPKQRVQPTRPFLTSGVDFSGPFNIKSMKGRGGKVTKAYLCLFVCLSTKAVHLELASDLSSECFLAALKRFTSRRGICSNLYSDNGSNFIGANTELRKLLKQSITTTTMEKMTGIGIQWHFIPARAPHFGGLWESAIKSSKKILRHVLGDVTPTFEEMVTIIAQVEGCLNSRPICPMSNNHDDLTALTPGHFLVGDILSSIPEPDLIPMKMNRLSRWQLTQQITQHFWKRWHQEYLCSLQQRPKWNQTKRNLQVGDLVLIKEDNLPPAKWLMGRVLQTHPGSDSHVRVVTLQTTKGVSKRPIVKLCLLLPEQNYDLN